MIVTQRALLVAVPNDTDAMHGKETGLPIATELGEERRSASDALETERLSGRRLERKRKRYIQVARKEKSRKTK